MFSFICILKLKSCVFPVQLSCKCCSRWRWLFLSLLLVDDFLWRLREGEEFYFWTQPAPVHYGSSLSLLWHSMIVPIKQAVKQTTCSQGAGIMAQVCVCVCPLVCFLLLNSSWQRLMGEEMKEDRGEQDGGMEGEEEKSVNTFSRHFTTTSSISWQLTPVITLSQFFILHI